jgi:hypothetical protein
MARRALKHPPARPIHWKDSHRLIPSRYSESGTVLSPLADTPEELEAVILLDGATNDRIQGEVHGLVGISTFELVYAIPNAHVVNGAFTHPNESGSRFNDDTRGAWYAADRQEASLAEIVYHKSRRLGEIILPEGRFHKPAGDVSTYDDWLADFDGTYHVLEPPEHFAAYLQPEPVPECYAAPQQLAKELLLNAANGIVYPSVRYEGARCMACFRPALVYNPRKSERLRIALTANETGYDHSVVRVDS